MKIVITKADLDTCLTGLIADVSAQDELVIAPGGAANEDLLDPAVVCIEAGGSGQVALNNFDHHDPDRYLPPACRQIYALRNGGNAALERLVDYVCRVDEAHPLPRPILFPALSNLFSGMRMVVAHPEAQFHTGKEILTATLASGLDPFRTLPALPGWTPYLQVKQKSQVRLDADLRNALLFFTRSGLRGGFASSPQPGVLGRLYRLGCQVAVAFDPFRTKYTIGSRGVALARLLPQFNAVDPGWGGRADIIGSPAGSRCAVGVVVKIVKTLRQDPASTVVETCSTQVDKRRRGPGCSGPLTNPSINSNYQEFRMDKKNQKISVFQGRCWHGN